MIRPTSDSMKWKKHCSSLNSKEQIKIRKAKRDHPSITMLPRIQATVSLLQYYLSCISRVCWALFSIPSISYEAWKAKEGNCFLLPFAIGLQWLREVQKLCLYIQLHFKDVLLCNHCNILFHGRAWKTPVLQMERGKGSSLSRVSWSERQQQTIKLTLAMADKKKTCRSKLNNLILTL